MNHRAELILTMRFVKSQQLAKLDLAKHGPLQRESRVKARL